MAMSPALSTSAYDLKIEGIFYNILSLEDMTCEVTSDDVNHTRYEGDVVIPGTVTYNGRALTVLKIGEGAFDGNPITSVSIPATVQQVGSDAFDDCTRLTKVIIEDGDTQLLFAHSSYIDDLWHQERGIEMFKESPLETVYLGRPVIYPGLNGLTGVYYSTDSGPFNENKTLREVIIGNSVKELYDFTFGDCENLQTVTFGSSLEKIGKEAFARCKKLASVAFPNSVKVIGSGAFLSCSELVDMELGNSVDTIGSNAFLDCGFSEVRLPNSVRYIGAQAFGCPNLKDFYFGSSVEFIGDAAFRGCSALTNVFIPNTVKELGNEVFMRCSALESVNIGNSVPQIGRSAFEGCTALKDVVIGSSVSKLGKDAFSGCTALVNIYVRNSVPPTGAEFENLAYMNASVYVPQGSLSSYQAANGWKNFWSISEFVPSGIGNAVLGGQAPPVIKAGDGCVTVENTTGNVVVYDMGGALIESVNAVGGRVDIVLPAGLYIIKVGDRVEKVTL